MQSPSPEAATPAALLEAYAHAQFALTLYRPIETYQNQLAFSSAPLTQTFTRPRSPTVPQHVHEDDRRTR